MPDGDSFLPRIQSVFYAVFDVRQGPKIVYQVPEGLIAVPPSLGTVLSSTSAISSPNTSLPTPPSLEINPGTGLNSRNSSTSLTSPISPIEQRTNSRALDSPSKRSSSSNRILFSFDDISKYVIPHSALCGRLVTCATRRHKIIGFPAQLRGNYERNYFRFNLCFVFERSADLSCYEPVVRKVSRVLTSCEEESAFLSCPTTSTAMHAILEQLYEDLNSYSETSIPVDRFNSIELKIFPFYPNPPAVKDCMVPLALINLSKRVEENWDLTMVKICRFIDGTNHVSRIANLAECDLNLTRQAIGHLLYYQVIMMIDIFQFSNMYTLRKSIQWLADEVHVREECGPYVTKPGRSIPDWPTLLHLYSRLKPGKTVLEWMETYGLRDLDIDVRRFTSFGVIKGFLRRVHRWPVLLPEDSSQSQSSDVTGRRRGKSISTPSSFPTLNSLAISSLIPSGNHSNSTVLRGRLPQTAPPNPEPLTRSEVSVTDLAPRVRKASAAETVLEQLWNRDLQKSAAGSTASTARNSWMHIPKEDTQDRDSPTRSRRESLVTLISPPSPSISKSTLSKTMVSRPRLSRSPSAPVVPSVSTVLQESSYPPELLALLDGEHHTDELATRFEAGWPVLEKWLVAAGGGAGDGDFGRISVIYR